VLIGGATAITLQRVATFLRRFPWIVRVVTATWRLGRPRYTVGAVGVVINPADEVLLVEHVFHPLVPWGLPGGWVDRSEALATAVVRELEEELQLSVSVETVIHIEIPPRRGYHIDIAYLCNTDDVVGKISHELLAYRWVKPEALPRLSEFHRQAIHKAFAYRSKTREV